MTASLCERLGYPADSKLLIVNADDFGMCNAANAATIEGLDARAYTSSTIMVPCPWFAQTAAYAADKPEADLGVHLVTTSEWISLKWGPVCGRDTVASLVDERGHFYRDVRSVYEHARLADVELECRAQIDQALAAGIDVTHLDCHMGTMQLEPRYHELYLRLAADYRLPVRMASARLLERMNVPGMRGVAESLGVLAPDELWFNGPPTPAATAGFWNGLFAKLRPGVVNEVLVHPGYDQPELRACCPEWEQRVVDHAFFMAGSTRARLRDLGVALIGYRELRDLQRAA